MVSISTHVLTGLAVCLCILGSCEGMTCDANWHSYDGHCYFISSDIQTYLHANVSCHAKNSKLVSIGSAEEDNFIRSLLFSVNMDQTETDLHHSNMCYLTSAFSRSAWLEHYLTHLHHHFADHTAHWVWGDGAQMTYSNWHRLEGLSSDTDSHLMCLNAQYDFEWDSVNIRGHHHYICEK